MDDEPGLDAQARRDPLAHESILAHGPANPL